MEPWPTASSHQHDMDQSGPQLLPLVSFPDRKINYTVLETLQDDG